ncbi:hypothetical protein Btru_030528 [Bulinus truncatus]|nr:hypothetical protein Btru_030528 [Bulinus truncatus]
MVPHKLIAALVLLFATKGLSKSGVFISTEDPSQPKVITPLHVTLKSEVIDLKKETVDPKVALSLAVFVRSEYWLTYNFTSELFRSFSRFNALKKKNPQLKNMIVIMPDRRTGFFFKMYKDSTLRKQFAMETIRFLREIDFDGIQINMNSYFAGEIVQRDKNDLVNLMKDMSEAFAAETLKPKKPKLILSVLPPARLDRLNQEYDTAGLSKYVDFLSVYTGDIMEKDTFRTFRHSSSLYGEDDSDTHSLDYFARYLVSKGADKQKLVFGLDTGSVFYTQGWPFTSKYKRFGVLGYTKVCLMLKNRIPLFDEVGLVPYFLTEEEGLMYNDEYSLRIKVIYVKSHGFGGVSNRDLDLDDYRGVCDKGIFPLSTAIRVECRKN